MSEQHIQISTSTLAMLLKALGQPGGEDRVRKALQAVIEGTPLGGSSLDGKLVDVGNGVKFPERDFAFAGIVGGVRLKRHRKGGGLVPIDQDRDDPDRPYVADTVYVGHRVLVTGVAKLYGGNFDGGSFRGGTFNGGNYFGGYFDGGDFYGGNFYGGTFQGGHFGNGDFYNGRFFGGLFRGGSCFGGIFHEGTFHDGCFYAGTFRGGDFNDFNAVYARPWKTYQGHNDADGGVLI